MSSGVDERVDIELTTGRVVISLSFINAPAECVRDVVTELVDTVLSPEHHALRAGAEQDIHSRAAPRTP